MICRARCVVVAVTAAGVMVGGCRKDTKKGLPAATEWSGDPAASAAPRAPATADPHAGMGMGGADPHAGMDMGGGDPHAGLDMGGGDPHAGLDMGGGDPHAGMDMGGGDPHAGMDMGGGDPHAGMVPDDPAMAAVVPPDPNRPIDSTRFLRGTIAPSKDTADKIKPGAIVFLSARPIEPTTGAVIGGPVAVERLVVDKFPLAFELSERNAMAAGTALTGNVVIVARVDADGEARSKQPGDVEGQVQAVVPSANLELTLDTVLR